tara:strand:+ start:132 stop:338 length:207 start_codon:yes stop_codon:yes gene_type:complete
MSAKEKLDFYLSKWVSRKLLVFCIGSSALFMGTLDSADWVIIATAYIAVEGITTIVEKLMVAKGKTKE